MTTTHVLLLVLAVLLVGGIWLYNSLQERRFRRQAERMFSQHREQAGDPVLDPDAVFAVPDRAEPALPEADDEPLFLPEREPEPAAWQQVEGKHSESNWAESAGAETTQSVPAPDRSAAASGTRTRLEPDAAVAGVEGAGVLPPSPLDSAIEYVARLRFTQPARLAFNRLLDGLRRLDKPVRVYGLREDGDWEEVGPSPAVAYRALELSIQLVDSGGPVSDRHLDDFCRVLYQFATDHGGAVSCPERKNVLERARELDRFCAEVDVMIGLNVVARDGDRLRGEIIDAVAMEAGLALNDHGVYLLHDRSGRALFSLVNQEGSAFQPGGLGFSTSGVSVLLDVPRVADGIGVFDRMTELCFELARQLKARVLDDRGHAVSPDTLQRDRELLNAHYARMNTSGIPAGSERALRLFA